MKERIRRLERSVEKERDGLKLIMKEKMLKCLEICEFEEKKANVNSGVVEKSKKKKVKRRRKFFHRPGKFKIGWLRKRRDKKTRRRLGDHK